MGDLPVHDTRYAAAGQSIAARSQHENMLEQFQNAISGVYYHSEINLQSACSLLFSRTRRRTADEAKPV